MTTPAKAHKLATIYTVSEGADVVARFVYLGDAEAFAERATEREPGRRLLVEDRRGYVSRLFENGWTPRV
jgi:hypothetical protein